MYGTVVPIRATVDVMDDIFPTRNSHLVVDEAHATGIYGLGGPEMVAQLGALGRKIMLAWLHTFCKALVASGGAFAFDFWLLVIHVLNERWPSAMILKSGPNTSIQDNLLNYACPPIDTTSLSNTLSLRLLVRFPRGRHGKKGTFFLLFLCYRSSSPGHSSVFTRTSTPFCCEARGPDSRTLYLLPGTPLRVPHHVIDPAAYTLSTSQSSTTTLDGTTTDTAYTTFNAVRARPICPSPRAQT
jgi:hypothetical protein